MIKTSSYNDRMDVIWTVAYEHTTLSTSLTIIHFRAAERLKILILVNLEINRKKTDNVYQLPTTAHVISLKRKTIISQTVCAVTL